MVQYVSNKISKSSLCPFLNAPEWLNMHGSYDGDEGYVLVMLGSTVRTTYVKALYLAISLIWHSLFSPQLGLVKWRLRTSRFREHGA